jgi:hypothetical protein
LWKAHLIRPGILKYVPEFCRQKLTIFKDLISLLLNGVVSEFVPRVITHQCRLMYGPKFFEQHYVLAEQEEPSPSARKLNFAKAS